MITWLQDFIRDHFRRRSATVRYAFPAVLALLTALGAVVATSQSISYVRVDTTPTYVEAGKTFMINIYASAAQPTNAVDIEVRFPEEQISVVGIDTGESVITIWTEEPYAEGGIIHLRGGVFRKGFLGEHLIARVEARATDSGVARIVASDATFLAGDGRGSEVSLSETGDEVAEVRISSAGTLSGGVSIGVVTDIDGDGDVDFSDIQRFMSIWRSRSSVLDFNGDGLMTFRDFGILLAHAFLR